VYWVNTKNITPALGAWAMHIKSGNKYQMRIASQTNVWNIVASVGRSDKKMYSSSEVSALFFLMQGQ